MTDLKIYFLSNNPNYYPDLVYILNLYASNNIYLYLDTYINRCCHFNVSVHIQKI